MHAYLAWKGGSGGDQPEIADEHVEDCNAVFADAKAKITTLCGTAPWHVEERLHLYDGKGNEITFGTTDIYVVPSDFVLVLDWKSGFDYNIANHHYAPQTKCYAMAAMQKHKVFKAICIEAYIKMQYLKIYETTMDECKATALKVINRQQQARYLKSQPNPHCKYCARLMSCPAIDAWVNMVGKCFGDLGAVKNLLEPEKITDPAEMTMAYAFATDILKKYAGTLKLCAERVEAAAIALARVNGNALPHWKLETKEGRKTIPSKHIKKAATLLEMPNENFMEGLTLSVPKMAEQYAKVNDIAQKNAKNSVEGLLFPLMEYGDPKKTLKRSATA